MSKIEKLAYKMIMKHDVIAKMAYLNPYYILWHQVNRKSRLMEIDLRSNTVVNFNFRGKTFGMNLSPHSMHDRQVYEIASTGGIYDFGLSEFLCSILYPSTTFVDVGANNGYFALLAHSILDCRGKVIAIEPDPSTYSRLVKNFEINHYTCATLLNMGISDREEFLCINESRIEDGLNSFVNLPFANPKTSVKTTTLDLLLEGDPNDKIIKIDVEGWESKVMKGSSRIFDEKNVTIIFEYNRYIQLRTRKLGFESPIRLIEGFGYNVRPILPDGTLGDFIKIEGDLSEPNLNLVATRNK